MLLRGSRGTRPSILGGLSALTILFALSQSADAGYRGLTDEHMAGYIDSTRVVTIDHGLGGRVQGMLHMLLKLAKSDRRVVIDGPCKSACTMLMSLGPSQVCLTDRAEMWFHQASLHDGQRSRFWTTAMFDLYPAAIQNYLRRRGGLDGDWIVMKDRQLRQMFPSRCGADDAVRPRVRTVQSRSTDPIGVDAWGRTSMDPGVATKMFSSSRGGR